MTAGQLATNALMKQLSKRFRRLHRQAVEVQIVRILIVGKQLLGIGGGIVTHRDDLSCQYIKAFINTGKEI